MSRPVRHHIVPQFFLRRFSREGQIVVVDRDDLSRRTQRPVRKALYVDNFYDAPMDGAPCEWWLENRLGEVENLAKPALDRVDAGGFPPNATDRDILRAFIVLGLLRGFRFRSMLMDAWNQILDTPLSTVQQATESLRIAFEAGDEEDEAARLIEEHRIDWVQRTPLPPDAAARVIPLLCDALSRDLATRSWHIVGFETPVLLTGDAPVALAGYSPVPSLGGLVHWHEIVMPIDSRKVIFLRSTSGDGGAMVSGTPADAEQINLVVASQCFRWIVHHPDIDPLAQTGDAGAAELGERGIFPRR